MEVGGNNCKGGFKEEGKKVGLIGMLDGGGEKEVRDLSC